MDLEKRSLTVKIRNVFVMLWVIFSTVVYGFLCMMVKPFNRNLSLLCGVLWNRHLLVVAGVKVSVKGTANLDPSKRYVFISNHQSHLDIPVLYNALAYNLSFIAKKELFQIPVFGWALHAAGHVWIDRTNARKAIESIKQAVVRLKNENISLVLFPEGTRSPDGKLCQVKQGSFSLVQQAGFEVVPVVIHDSYRIMRKHSNRLTGGTVHVTIGSPVTIDPAHSKAEIAAMFQKKLSDVLDAGFGE